MKKLLHKIIRKIVKGDEIQRRRLNWELENKLYNSEQKMHQQTEQWKVPDHDFVRGYKPTYPTAQIVTEVSDYMHVELSPHRRKLQGVKILLDDKSSGIDTDHKRLMWRLGFL